MFSIAVSSECRFSGLRKTTKPFVVWLKRRSGSTDPYLCVLLDAQSLALCLVART